MKLLNRTAGILAAALCLALPVTAQSADKSAKDAPMAAALKNAMTPGEGHKKLNSLVGTFNVKMRIWVTPTGAPEEFVAATVCGWVLGERYVQCMLSENTPNAPFSGTNYIAYDNASKNFQAVWMDTGSTGISLYTGKVDATGKTAVLKGSVTNAVTGKPSPVQLHINLEPDGNRLTQVWGQGKGGKMVKLMELEYTKTK